MVDLPKNTFAFAPGEGAKKRVNLRDELTAPNLIFNTTDIDVIRKNETQYKRLFLKTLSTLLFEAGHNISAETLFNANVANFFSSQSILFIKNFDADKKYVRQKRVGNYSFKNESTTPYRFDFNFQENNLDGITIRTPILGIDSKAINLLYSHGVPHESITRWAKDFLRISDVAEHDYIHQLTLPYAQKGKNTFCENHVSVLIKSVAVQGSVEKAYTGHHLEDHALALHAQILRRLFKDSPKYKEQLLRRVAEGYSHIYEMQQQALSGDKTEEEKHQIQEAITYFTEIYSHRLFRVFSPADPALHEAILQLNTPEGPQNLSIAQAMDKITLVTPEHLMPAPVDGLGKLEHHCSEWLGDTYRAIHHIDSFPLAQLGQSLFEHYSAQEQIIKDTLAGGEKVKYAQLPSPDILDIHYETALDTVRIFSEAQTAIDKDPRVYATGIKNKDFGRGDGGI